MSKRERPSAKAHFFAIGLAGKLDRYGFLPGKDRAMQSKVVYEMK